MSTIFFKSTISTWGALYRGGGGRYLEYVLILLIACSLLHEHAYTLFPGFTAGNLSDAISSFEVIGQYLHD